MATIENLYVGDGATVLYSFTFPYIEETDVKVSLDGVITTAYSLANATTVEFVAAPATGVAIRIYRDTSVDDPKAVFYPGSAIRAQDLNDNFEQNLFVIQEADFNNQQSATDSAAALATAQTADTKADQANVQSAAAQASAAQAQTDATQAAADAASAQANATQAAADASDAQVSAAQANTAVQSAAIFTPVPNVAAIPSSPADQDRVSVLDSTGIGSFTPLTGLPVGPTYDSGAYVNLVYQATGATWNFVVYGPNDPDSRYLLDTVDSVTPANLDRAYVESGGGNMTGSLTLGPEGGPAAVTVGVGGTIASVGSVQLGPIGNPNIQLTPTGDAVLSGNISVSGSNGISYGTSFIKFEYSSSNTVLEAYQITANSGSGGQPRYLVWSEAGGNIRLGYNQFGLYYRVNNAGGAIIVGPPSDYRLKRNVEESTYGTDAIKALRPVTYKFNEGEAAEYCGSDVQVGFIAHEANDVIPGSARGEKDGEDYQTINTYPIVAALTKALQESITRIETLEAKVQTLENN